MFFTAWMAPGKVLPQKASVSGGTNVDQLKEHWEEWSTPRWNGAAVYVFKTESIASSRKRRGPTRAFEITILENWGLQSFKKVWNVHWLLEINSKYCHRPRCLLLKIKSFQKREVFISMYDEYILYKNAAEESLKMHSIDVIKLAGQIPIKSWSCFPAPITDFSDVPNETEVCYSWPSFHKIFQDLASLSLWLIKPL